MAGVMRASLLWPVCVTGFSLFRVGALAGGYIMLKTGRWTLGASLNQYRRNPQHARLPVVCLYTCLTLGIAIRFGAILAS